MRAKEINFGGQEVNGIRVIRLIGQGNWADVYLAEDVTSLEKFAVKTTSHRKFNEVPKLRELVKAEITILKACRNPHVVRLVNEFSHKEHQFIVLEYCNGLELGDVLRREKKLEESTAKIYLKQILDGFRGLHEANAMHRDFKVENVMLHDGICKIVDLGFGKQLFEGDVARTKLGSNLTMAPQVMRGLPYDFRADLWSIGIVYYQMLFGKFPFQAKTIPGLLEFIRNHDYSFQGGEVSEDTKDFIIKCLKFNPEQRLRWTQVYKHPLILEQEISFGPTQSKINVQDNFKFYQSLKLLSEKISTPPELNEQSQMLSFLNASQDEKPIFQSEILQSSIKAEESINIIPQSSPQKQMPVEEPSQNYFYFKVNQKEETQRIQQILKDIKYRYDSRVKGISSLSECAIAQIKKFEKTTCQISLLIHCLLLKESFLKLSELWEGLNQGKNIFNLEINDFELFIKEEGAALSLALVSNLKEIKLKFQNFTKFLQLKNFKDVQRSKALECIEFKDNQWMKLLNKYVDGETYQRLQNLDLCINQAQKKQRQNIFPKKTVPPSNEKPPETNPQTQRKGLNRKKIFQPTPKPEMTTLKQSPSSSPTQFFFNHFGGI